MTLAARPHAPAPSSRICPAIGPAGPILVKDGRAIEPSGRETGPARGFLTIR